MQAQASLTDLRNAAELADAKSQLELGAQYATGGGVARGPQQAVLWYGKSADQGYARAQTGLGIIYAQGNVAAQYNLTKLESISK